MLVPFNGHLAPLPGRFPGKRDVAYAAAQSAASVVFETSLGRQRQSHLLVSIGAAMPGRGLADPPQAVSGL